LAISSTIPHANTIYEKLQLISVREIPNYPIEVDMVNGVDVDAYANEEDLPTLISQLLELEKILTEARLPEIINRISYSNNQPAGNTKLAGPCL
jgi:hypothetical protein